jgi:hypothetical protein
VELLPSWTKAGSWTLGRDPLGMQATSVRLYRSLIPGLTNVTNRLRYYAFYCWVIQHYEEIEHSGNDEKWKVFIRRAEALYALACYIANREQSDGLAGGRWAGSFCQTLTADTIDLRPHTDRPSEGSQYLSAARGNFGQFYIASMTEVGFLSPSSPIPIVSDQLGRELAQAFADSVGEAIKLISTGIRTGKVTPAELSEIGQKAHPSHIPEDSREMELLRDYLLAARQEHGSGTARRSSAWLLLDLIRLGIDANDQTAIRRAFYNRKLPNGSTYAAPGVTLDRWRAFQANELCHISFEALFNGLLAKSQDDPLGVDPHLLIGELLDPILSALKIEGQTWGEWATEAGSGFAESEESLAQDILSSLGDPRQASSLDGLSSALQLIATLWFRWGSDGRSVRDTIQHFAGSGGRSLAGVLRSLDNQAAQTVEKAMRDVIRRHLITDHLAIAGRKLASSGTFTYHFTLSDGVVSDGRIAAYGYTTPRLQNLIRFVRDAGLFDGMAVTQAGARFLNDSQPV